MKALKSMRWTEWRFLENFHKLYRQIRMTFKVSMVSKNQVLIQPWQMLTPTRSSVRKDPRIRVFI